MRYDWPHVDSLDAAGLRVVDWLDGRIRTLPSHLGPPMKETRSIAGGLRALNAMGGVVTDNSQPGQWDFWGRQRATVQGIATAAATQLLGERALAGGLLWEHAPVFEVPSIRPLTRVAQAWFPPFVWTRSALFQASDLTFLIDSIDVPHSTVASWHSFSCTDLTWGRRRFLWDTLTGASA